MRNTLRRGLLSVVAGVALALASMLTVSTIKVRAEEEGGGVWTCPNHPNPNCSWLTCFHNGTGGHECKYMRTDNTSDCTSSESCEFQPWIQ